MRDTSGGGGLLSQHIKRKDKMGGSNFDTKMLSYNEKNVMIQVVTRREARVLTLCSSLSKWSFLLASL